MFVDVALGFPSGISFQYSVPEAFASEIAIGKRVFLTVRARRMVGMIVGISDQAVVIDVKPIESVIDAEPVMGPKLLELTRWMAETYFCSWGQAIEAALPAPFKKGKVLMKSRKTTSTGFTNSADKVIPMLTSDQEKAFDEIKEVLDRRQNASYLLYGITGSGKTEVYMRLIDRLLKEKRGSIVLVPEISLTPQTVGRFNARFGDVLAIIHSRLTPAKRVEEWHRIREGKAQVVIGARSALFSPVQDLGLVVIDEEHDTSYKQDETPRYHAREVAKKRCELENAVLILGSATPSLESFYGCEKKTIRLAELPKRVENRPLPIVEIVDMRREKTPKGGEKIFSHRLEQAIKDSVFRKEQVMLLLNRRGFFTYLHCAACGFVCKCPDCRIPLAYHYDKASLLCHVCYYKSVPERLCPACQKNYLHYFGMGTQKVESEARALFGGARVARMDSDSTARQDSHETILTAFKNHEIDILIGTQMIAKGHDFPNVSLIGVINADTSLHIPDFRSAERTFDLLTQVAGRAGRGDIPGKVMIQTYLPEHYSIQSAKDHNYREFYEKEITFRQELFMPPHSSLTQLVFSGASEKEVVRQVIEFKKWAETLFASNRFKWVGPAPCLISKERGLFKWNLFVKGPSVAETNPLLRQALDGFKKKAITITVNVDPQ